jgi:transmembrane sensor
LQKNNSYTVLKEGKVQVSLGKAVSELNPGEKFLLNKETNKASIEKIDIEPYSSWVLNKLMFDNTSLNIIIDQLEKWYGVEIESDKSLDLEKRFTLTVIDESLEDVFSLFNEITPISFQKENNKFVLSSNE